MTGRNDEIIMTLSPTKEGKRLLLATLLIALAAFNTGNNLIYLILAMMLSILAISVVVPAVNMRGLTLRVSAEGPVFAGQGAGIGITVLNSKRSLPSYSLRVIMTQLGSVADGAFNGRGYIPYVPPASEASDEAEVFFKKRGLYSYGDFVIESGFPFIFFNKKIKAKVNGSVTVYPEIKETEAAAFSYRSESGALSLKKGRGDEMLSLREFINGDDVKHIHWRASARSDRLMVREFAVEEPKEAVIFLDDIGPLDGEAFEKAVSYAASISRELIVRGFRVGLSTSRKHIAPSGGPEQFFRILDLLAGVMESNSDKFQEPESPPDVLILKSENSPLRKFAPEAGLVVYASDL